MKKFIYIITFLVPLIALAQQPLPLVGTDIPVNVLMCKSADDLKEVVETAYTVEPAEYAAYVAARKIAGECEVGGGAKIFEVEERPFYETENRQIHLLKVRFGGKDFYTNFNR